MQRDIGSRPRIGCGGEVVCVGLTGDLKHHHFNGVGNRVSLGEPFTSSPAFHDGLRVFVAPFGEIRHIMEGLEHEQRVF